MGVLTTRIRLRLAMYITERMGGATATTCYISVQQRVLVC
jgi:hypothetical protein